MILEGLIELWSKLTRAVERPDAANPNDRDRNLIVNFLELQGPLGWQGPLPLSHQRLMIAKPG